MFSITEPNHNPRRHSQTSNLVNQLRFLVVTLLLLLLCSRNATAQLKSMDDDQLKASTAQAGMVTFTMDNNTAQLFLDIHIETYATINTFSAGYHYLNPTDTAKGWDVQWNNVVLGNSADNPLTIDGLMLIADFDSTDSSKLKRVVFGSNYLNGTITANMLSYTGCFNPGLISGGVYDTTPVALADRTDLSQGGTTSTTFNFVSNTSQKMGLFFIMDMGGTTPAVRIAAGYDSATLTAATTPWWKAP
jgi:hypothetical protein